MIEKIKEFSKESVSKALIDLHITKKDLAQRLGVSRTYLTYVLAGTKKGYELRELIVNYLNEKIDEKNINKEN